MVTALATRCLLVCPSLGQPSRASSSSSSSSSFSSSWPSSSHRPGRRPSSRLRCSSPQVDAGVAAGKGGEYRPCFADDLLLAFFRSKIVEVSTGLSLTVSPSHPTESPSNQMYSSRSSVAVPAEEDRAEVVVEDDEDDDEDDDDDDKDDDELDGQEGDANGKSKQSRSEKSRKAKC